MELYRRTGKVSQRDRNSNEERRNKPKAKREPLSIINVHISSIVQDKKPYKKNTGGMVDGKRTTRSRLPVNIIEI